MNERRSGYNFSVDEKINIRARAQGKCEFPGEMCERPNTRIVNHITGCYEARLAKMTKETISDPDLNAIMLCKSHSALHDIQEAEHVELLKRGVIFDSMNEIPRRRRIQLLKKTRIFGRKK